MLYHVTMTHSPDDCPLWDPELQAKVREFDAKSGALAKELGVTIHFEVTGAPDHVFYSLLESEDYGKLQRYLAAGPIRQTFTIRPVVPVHKAAETLLPRQE